MIIRIAADIPRSSFLDRTAIWQGTVVAEYRVSECCRVETEIVPFEGNMPDEKMGILSVPHSVGSFARSGSTRLFFQKPFHNGGESAAFYKKRIAEEAEAHFKEKEKTEKKRKQRIRENRE